MKKLLVILAFAILLMPMVPGSMFAAEPTGDPSWYNGWNSAALDGAGVNYAYLLPGMSYVGSLRGLANAPNGTWNGFTSCATAADTFCYLITQTQAWPIAVTGVALGAPIIKSPNPATIGWTYPTITVPLGTVPGTVDKVIARVCYYEGVRPYPEMADCVDPNYSAAYGLYMYSADTLIITVIASPITIEQDSVTLVDLGQTEAYIPFDIRNWAGDPGMHHYTITSEGTVGDPIAVADSISIDGGSRKTVYGVVNAGDASICDYDHLTIIAWRTYDATVYYDTCVQLIHVISPRSVPLFTVPVVTILVLALILAAAVFMRRRAVSKA